MQQAPVMMYYIVFGLGLLVQFVWIVIGRGARNSYLRSVTHFSRPSSTLGRFYTWRISRVYHVLLEGIALDLGILAAMVVLVFPSVSLVEIIDTLPILALVLVLTFMSAVQEANRIRAVLRAEQHLLRDISSDTDKVGRVELIVESLLSQGKMADGSVWMALFNISLVQNPIGYAVRDVLMEKRSEFPRARGPGKEPSVSPDNGPGIT
ncbi:MAG: hypothetical protein JSW61_06735 [Candidatus Thorarchaeota archaeon]|nr:MAG: hypothetical protein JSW61_06735 [Candidatus Thorarchaeota archaeon]